MKKQIEALIETNKELTKILERFLDQPTAYQLYKKAYVDYEPTFLQKLAFRRYEAGKSFDLQEARRQGKTTTLLIIALHAALRTPGTKILVVVPNVNSISFTKTLLSNLCRRVGVEHPIGNLTQAVVINDSYISIQTSEQVINSLGVDYDIACYDEYAIIKNFNEVKEAVRRHSKSLLEFGITTPIQVTSQAGKFTLNSNFIKDYPQVFLEILQQVTISKIETTSNSIICSATSPYFDSLPKNQDIPWYTVVVEFNDKIIIKWKKNAQNNG